MWKRCCQGQNPSERKPCSFLWQQMMSKVIWSHEIKVMAVWWMPACHPLTYLHLRQTGPPSARRESMKVTRLMPCITGAWFHSARQSGTAGREKSKQKARQRVKWPRDVNNLGDWGRPALINAGQHCWLSGIVTGAQSLDSTLWMSSSLPCHCPQLDPQEEFSPPLTPALTPCMIMRGMFARGKYWPKLCQLNVSLLTPHHHYCHLTLPPLHRWFSVLLLEIHTLKALCGKPELRYTFSMA